MHGNGYGLLFAAIVVLSLLGLIWLVGASEDGRRQSSHDLYLRKECVTGNGRCIIPR